MSPPIGQVHLETRDMAMGCSERRSDMMAFGAQMATVWTWGASGWPGG